MGLFSKFGKNKQQSNEDSGYYRAADDRALTERARSKRASSEGGAVPGATRRSRKDGAADPVLPEKKRARRRLVGAIALALAVAIGLPMVLDSEPKPLANDIAIQIPSKDKPAEAEPAPAVAEPKPRQADALDQSEEIVEPADEPKEPVKVAAAPVATPPQAEPKPVEHKPEPKAEVPKLAEHKPEPKPEAKHETKPEAKKEEPKKVAEAKPEPKKPEPKPESKPESKPEPKHETKDDAARALAILEGKPAAAADASRFVVQVAALSAKDKVDELQGKLRDAGIKSFTQKSPTGELTRVKVGPFGSREEAEKARAKLQKIGLSGSVIPA